MTGEVRPLDEWNLGLAAAQVHQNDVDHPRDDADSPTEPVQVGGTDRPSEIIRRQVVLG